MCHLGPALFEDTKRDRSLVKKKATTSPTPGPLIPPTQDSESMARDFVFRHNDVDLGA